MNGLTTEASELTEESPRLSRSGTRIVLTPNILGADGMSGLSRALVRALQQNGDAVTVQSLHDGAPNENAAGREIPLRGAASSSARFVTAALDGAWRADARSLVIAVHLHLAPALFAYIWRGARAVVVLCGIEAWKPLTRLQRQALRRCDRLVAISRHTADRFREVNGGDWPEIVVCHPGIPDLEERAGLTADADRAGLKPGPCTALIVARMAADERYKGHDALLEVWPSLRRRVPGARLIVVGDGDDRGRLEAKAATLGLAGAVEFVGKADETTLVSMYETCAFFAMPSLHEGFGLVFLEAMRAGKACLAGPGAAAEIVRDGETGLVVDPSDRERLTSALATLFLDVERRDQFGRAGRTRFLAEFTETRFAERLTGALDLRSVQKF